MGVKHSVGKPKRRRTSEKTLEKLIEKSKKRGSNVRKKPQEGNSCGGVIKGIRSAARRGNAEVSGMFPTWGVAEQKKDLQVRPEGGGAELRGFPHQVGNGQSTINRGSKKLSW